MFTKFTQEFHHTIDENNRLAIPSSLRKCMDDERDGSGFYLTPGFEGCLAIYPPRQFDSLTKKIDQLMFTNKKARTFQRLFFSKSSRVNYDKQGRIIVPLNLKEHANLKKDVIIIGVLDRIEVWDSKLWDEFISENIPNFEKEAEDLFQLGFAPNQQQVQNC